MDEEIKNDIQAVSQNTDPFTPGAAVGVLAVSVIFGYAVTLVFAFLGILSASADTGKTTGEFVLKLGMLIGTICFVVPAFIYARMEKKSMRSLFRFKPVSSQTIFFTFILALGLIVVTDTIDKWIAPMINAYLDSTIGALSPELMSDKILAKMKEEFMITGLLSGTLLILAAVFAAGFCEEMLIRGVFQGSLEKRLSAAYAIVISSLVFSFIHINPWGGIQIFVIAIFLGLIAWRADSIYPTIIMHALNNFIVILFNNLKPETLAWYGDENHIDPLVIGVGVVLMIGGLAGLFRGTPPRTTHAT
jgi:membrane protease YdiL (CAAX protease family)